MYTIPVQRCKLVADGARVRAPVEAINCAEDAIRLFRDYFERESLPHERVMAALVNGSNKIMALIRVSEGGLHGCALTAKDVLRPAIAAGASAIVLSHNHPSGNPDPSREDIEMTRHLKSACDVVGVSLLDHVIIAAGGLATSMLEQGMF